MIDTIRHLGRYHILAELGHGGFGTVFKALDTSLEREVALKVLDPLLARDPSFILRFKQEARVTAGYVHPNIAVVFEVGEADGRQFIAMQYIPGRNLRDILEAEGPLAFERIVSIVRQIGAALDYAHAHGAIHRDVKPSNIILDEDGHATLTDFGIAKAVEGTLVQTTSRAVMGTPYYASPEQAESKPLDGRSDLYSLGIVAYELCTRRVPFSADTTPSLLYKIVHEDPLPPSQANSRVAGPIEQVLLKAIARQPEQRYQSGREFGDALAAAVTRARAEQLRPLYESAVARLDGDEFDAAETNLLQVLAIEPEHQEAQALLAQLHTRRELACRYQSLAETIARAREEAAALKQAAPNMADPAGVLRLLGPAPAEPGPPPPRSTPAPPPTSAPEPLHAGDIQPSQGRSSAWQRLVVNPRAWSVGRREVVVMVIGAVLHGMVSLAMRVGVDFDYLFYTPTIIIPLFLGALFGPWVGLGSGLAGSLLVRFLAPAYFPPLWFWYAGQGLAGFVSGMALVRAHIHELPKLRSVLAWSAAALVVSFLFVCSAASSKFGADPLDILSASYPQIILDFAAGAVLLPILYFGYKWLHQRFGW